MACPCENSVVVQSPTSPCFSDPCGSQVFEPAADICHSTAFVSAQACEIQTRLLDSAALAAKEGALLKAKNCLEAGDKKLHEAAYFTLLAQTAPFIGCMKPDGQAAFLARLERIDGLCACVCEFTTQETATGREQPTPCNADPCLVIIDIMQAQGIYYGNNGVFATSFAQLGVNIPTDCYDYALVQDPASQLVHTIAVAVPKSPTVGFIYLGYTDEIITPVFTAWRTIVPTIVLPSVFPNSSPFFDDTYTAACNIPPPP